MQNIILVVKPGFTFLFCGFAIRLSSSSIQLHSFISPSLHRRNRSSFKICVQPVVSHPLFTNMWNRYYWKMKKLKYSCLIYWRKYFAQMCFKHWKILTTKQFCDFLDAFDALFYSLLVNVFLFISLSIDFVSMLLCPIHWILLISLISGWSVAKLTTWKCSDQY